MYTPTLQLSSLHFIQHHPSTVHFNIYHFSSQVYTSALHIQIVILTPPLFNLPLVTPNFPVCLQRISAAHFNFYLCTSIINYILHFQLLPTTLTLTFQLYFCTSVLSTLSNIHFTLYTSTFQVFQFDFFQHRISIFTFTRPLCTSTFHINFTIQLSSLYRVSHSN